MVSCVLSLSLCRALSLAMLRPELAMKPTIFEYIHSIRIQSKEILFLYIKIYIRRSVEGGAEPTSRNDNTPLDRICEVSVFAVLPHFSGRAHIFGKGMHAQRYTPSVFCLSTAGRHIVRHSIGIDALLNDWPQPLQPPRPAEPAHSV